MSIDWVSQDGGKRHGERYRILVGPSVLEGSRGVSEVCYIG